MKSEEILSILKKTYPNARIALKYSSNWELLVSVILSAQCTDERVNIVTEKLFRKYETIEDYAKADTKQFEQDIRSTGFYHNKAKNILAAAKMVLNDFGGNVPDSMDEILKLPGVARKTANVVLGNAYGKVEGIAVDTHVKRLSNRLGLTKNQDPAKIERDLMKTFDKKDWFKLTYLLIEHGRNICDAKRPMCDECPLASICPSAFEFPHFKK